VAAGPSLANRTLTVVAATFLAFDGACLVAAAVWLRRPLMGVMGVCLAASSGLVFVYWRWHQQQIREITAARQALAEQTRAMRDVLLRD
jgi:HAMP domain-containing protein